MALGSRGFCQGDPVVHVMHVIYRDHEFNIAGYGPVNSSNLTGIINRVPMFHASSPGRATENEGEQARLNHFHEWFCLRLILAMSAVILEFSFLFLLLSSSYLPRQASTSPVRV